MTHVFLWADPQVGLGASPTALPDTRTPKLQYWFSYSSPHNRCFNERKGAQ